MFDQFFIAMIGETPGQSADDARMLLDLPQQQSAGIRGDRPTIETSHHFPPPEGLKLKRLLNTLCLHRLPPCYWHKCCSQTYLCQRRQPIAIGVVRYAG